MLKSVSRKAVTLYWAMVQDGRAINPPPMARERVFGAACVRGTEPGIPDVAGKSKSFAEGSKTRHKSLNINPMERGLAHHPDQADPSGACSNAETVRCSVCRLSYGSGQIDKNNTTHGRAIMSQAALKTVRRRQTHGERCKYFSQ
jgi:hypothetical protein